ncbi:GNAT family N-acetyltransferase [Leifsonia sp. NPDC058230]|uniref:GNAT family N-acetyltransferase n=1 Tax=Leifsonia sp. NPDC058230 TaxID=3346391 RepID=UPI0036D7770D
MTTLRTVRLVLDAPRESDIDAVFHACQDPEILRWVPLPDPYTRESAEFFVRSYVSHGAASGSYTVWAIRIDDEPLIGVVEVRRDESAGSASVGCWLAAVGRGHGYMREALDRVVEHAVDPAGLGFTRLCWETLEGNATSRRLAESVGFVFEPASVHVVDFRGETRSAIVGVLKSADRAGRL